VIAEYAASLAGRLSFDRSLSRCVREEVEDHLWQAVAADPAGDSPEAQRRAIENFGDPRAIAAQFAVDSLARQAGKTGVTAILVIAGVFLAMATRLTWYDLTQWGLCEDLVDLSETVGMIDRSAFWLAAIGGAAGWFYRRQLERFVVLCAIASGGIIACVICDGVLTALRLSGWEFSADFLVPLFSMAIEVVCAGVLAFYVGGLPRRMASTAALQRA
jgi:hypothetical protein